MRGVWLGVLMAAAFSASALAAGDEDLSQRIGKGDPAAGKHKLESSGLPGMPRRGRRQHLVDGPQSGRAVRRLYH